VEEEGGGGGIIEEIVAAITSILAPSVYFAIFNVFWKYRLKCLPYQLVSLFVVRHSNDIHSDDLEGHHWHHSSVDVPTL
jgi:hypothetical protein